VPYRKLKKAKKEEKNPGRRNGYAFHGQQLKDLLPVGVRPRIYQMLKKGEYHYGRDPVNHEMKMGQYRRFLEKQKRGQFRKKSLDFYHRRIL
jgi:hypothetical protein